MNFIDAYNPIDLFIITTVLISVILGLWKGFMRSLTALTGLVAGFIVAGKYYPEVQVYIYKISSLNPQIAMIISMLVLFVMVQAVFVLIRKLLDALIDITHLGWLDRVMGALMGASAGFVIVASLVQLLVVTAPEWAPIKSSSLIGPMESLSLKAMDYAPESAKEQVNAMVNKWRGFQETTPAKGENRAGSGVTASPLPIARPH
jgi:membrane protein required for colicin V production